jgi:chitosanase
MIDADEKKNIKQIINVAEMGVKNIRYGDIYVYADGPGDARQLTLSAGFTESGNLKTVVERYAKAGGTYSDEFKRYVGRIGKTPYLVNDKYLIQLFKKAGNDPVMQKVQEEVLEEKYYKPALKFFEDNGFTSELALLVIYDSFIHSGSVLDFLRSRFGERTPKNGGDEKAWVTAYTKVRHDWLKNHSRKILRNTTYRTQAYLNYIKANNWDLSQKEIMNGVVI